MISNIRTLKSLSKMHNWKRYLFIVKVRKRSNFVAKTDFADSLVTELLAEGDVRLVLAQVG